ncbi:hypothetical protein MKC54_09200 [[Clostridium] innocuum]|nr:hypothetical protein [[Clostridium] innocuum]MCR0577061.1 hypothetical protein [[Clostridium] innocuum]
MSYKGIDISAHNGNVNWEAIKNSGIQFAMIRASWGHFTEDAKVRRNVSECKRVGMPFGLYHYSYADSDANAKVEATKFLALAHELGGYTYPLNLDMEDADGWKARNGVGDDQNLRTIKIFKDTIEGAGDYLTLYMSKSWFDRLRSKNASLIDSIDAWLAHWGISAPSMGCGMWQYTSDGVVSGSSARTDMNIAYKDYPSILASMGHKADNKPTPAPAPKPEPTPTPSTGGIKAGDKVKVKNSATNYVTGETIPDWVKERAYTVMQVGSGKVLLKEIMSWVRTADLVGQADATSGLFVGKVVKVKNTAKTYATGETIPNWVKNQSYTIYQIGNGKVLLKEIMSWVKTADIA